MNEIALMLGGTIGMGVLIIIFGMVLNVINALKSKELGEALFGHNGVAGLVFYIGALLLAGNLFLSGVYRHSYLWQLLFWQCFVCTYASRLASL